MKKKILLFTIVVIFVFASGCSNNSWKKKIQISNLKYEDNYVKGKIKNMTDKYLSLHIKFLYESGSLKLNGYCFQDLKANELTDLKCLEYEIDNTYKIEIESIDIKEKEIPSLNVGEINQEALEYHFKDIFYNHLSLMLSTIHSIINENDRYFIDKITNYENDELKIEYSKKVYDTLYSFIETYSKTDSRLKKIYIFMIGNPNIERIALGLSTSEPFGSKITQAKSIYNAIKTETESGYCRKISDWCISYVKDEEFSTSTIDIYEYESK